MCTYLKNMEGKKTKDFKNKSFDSIQKMFDRAFKRVNTFVNFRTDLVEVTAAQWDPTRGILLLGQQVVSELVALKNLSRDMDQDSTHMVATSKVPMLKPKNGNTAPKTIVVKGVEKVIPPTNAEEKDQKRLEVKARKKRFGGNAATKKTQRNLLKLQKLVSQLELLGEMISQEDVNQKLLRSLSFEWNTHAIVWRNKAELETMNMDDLYNNLKVYEA
ncbi:hypothetical protein Tco_0982400, partial [Tanacetum coccineum]